MKSLKDLIGPIRSTKKERIEGNRIRVRRERELNNLKSKFGPNQSLLKMYRDGKISKSALDRLPFPMLSDSSNIKFGLKQKSIRR